MTTVNTYLIFNGNCQKAFNFYKSVFGKEFAHVSKYKDMPPNEGGKNVTKEEEEKIMHIALQLSKETVLMGGDTAGEWATHFKQGNNFFVSVNADSKQEADRIFNELSRGGKVLMSMNNMFWGDYFGMLEDKFGVNWMVSFPMNRPQK